MYFEDLTTYNYFYDSTDSHTFNIGWLDVHHQFNQAQIADDFLDKLFQFCLSPVNETRGYHECPFCINSNPWGLEVERNGQIINLGSAEIRVKGLNSKIYAAPDLIYHYVEAHNYSPPEEFIKAVCSS